jgi:hypothetical protein
MILEEGGELRKSTGGGKVDQSTLWACMGIPQQNPFEQLINASKKF